MPPPVVRHAGARPIAVLPAAMRQGLFAWTPAVAVGGQTAVWISRVTAWMAAVADATNLPVDAVAIPEGAALGAAYFARMAAGLETSLNDSARWAGVGRRIEPDPAWVRAADARYARFTELGTGT